MFQFIIYSIVCLLGDGCIYHLLRHTYTMLLELAITISVQITTVGSVQYHNIKDNLVIITKLNSFLTLSLSMNSDNQSC